MPSAFVIKCFVGYFLFLGDAFAIGGFLGEGYLLDGLCVFVEIDDGVLQIDGFVFVDIDLGVKGYYGVLVVFFYFFDFNIFGVIECY